MHVILLLHRCTQDKALVVDCKKFLSNQTNSSVKKKKKKCSFLQNVSLFMDKFNKFCLSVFILSRMICFILSNGEWNIFQRVKMQKYSSCENINLQPVLTMRGCFVSFVLTFRNLCKSALAYSPEFVIFCFLLSPYFPNLFLYVSLKLFFSGLWGFYWYHFTFWWNSRFSNVSSKLHISFSRDCIPAVSIFSYVE